MEEVSCCANVLSLCYIVEKDEGELFVLLSSLLEGTRWNGFLFVYSTRSFSLTGFWDSGDLRCRKGNHAYHCQHKVFHCCRATLVSFIHSSNVNFAPDIATFMDCFTSHYIEMIVTLKEFAQQVNRINLQMCLSLIFFICSCQTFRCVVVEWDMKSKLSTWNLFIFLSWNSHDNTTGNKRNNFLKIRLKMCYVLSCLQFSFDFTCLKINFWSMEIFLGQYINIGKVLIFN